MPKQDRDNSGYFPVQSSPVINMASKMDDRTNNEYLDVDPNTTSFTFVNLQNADLFNTKSLSTRLGVIDVSTGIANLNTNVQCLTDLTNNPVKSGVTTQSPGAIKQECEPPGLNRYGMIIVPSGNFNLFSGNITVIGYAPFATNPNNTVSTHDYQMQMRIYQLDQVSLPSSGVSWFSGTTTHGLHNIALSGTYGGTLASIGADPVALSNSGVTFNVGNTFSGGFTTSNPVNVPYVFNAPFPLLSGSVYFMEMRFYTTDQIAGNNSLQFYFDNTITATNDYQPNTVLAQTLTPPNSIVPTNLGAGTKGQLRTCLSSYLGAGYILNEWATANLDLAAPLFSGQTFAGQQSNENVVNQTIPFKTTYFTGSTMVPNFDTTTVEFGQVISVPSGTWNLTGGYFFATPQARSNWSSYTRNMQPISGNGYTLGYTMNLSVISGVTGSIAGGNYSFNERDIIATYSGTYTFDASHNDSYPVNDSAPPNNNLNKIYGLFTSPPTVNLTTATNYLLSVKFYDAFTGNPFTDYSYRNITTGIYSPTTQFQSFIQTGFDNSLINTSGTYVTNYNNDGETFISPSGDAFSFAQPTNDNLTCGLMYSPSGNAITGIYDYRIGSSRAQRVIYTQGNNVNEFPLNNFPATQIIFSGNQTGQNFKYSFATYQNLMFAHQYAQTSGLCWDQIFINPSGYQSMQLHGQQPQFTLIEVSGVLGSVGASGNVAASGINGWAGNTVTVLLATQMNSGGYRANQQSITISGSHNSYIQILGPSGLANKSYGGNMVLPSGVGFPYASQYAFDVAPQSTYVFVAPGSGTSSLTTGATTGANIFYLAGLINQASGTATNQLNPLPNSGTFFNPSGSTFIGDLTFNTLTQQIPNVLNFNQSYLNQQVATPKFKKIIIYKDYMIGIGDPNFPSRIWYSQQLAPQIWGTDGNVCGFIELDPDNGSPITGMEIFKDYLIVFKYNSTYRISYTQNPSIPFYVTQISNTLGSLGFFGTVSTDYGAFALSQFGPILATYNGVESIGDEIVPFFNTLDHTDLTFAVAIHDRLRQQIYWSISSQNLSLFRNTGLVYSYVEKAWNIRQGGMWNAAGIVGDVDNFNMLYTGDVLGQIQQISTGNSDQDVLFTDETGNALQQNISLEAETPWLNFGNSMDLKQLRNIRINCATSAQRLRVDVYYDQNPNKIQYTRYINMNVPVINRVTALGGRPCRTVKFVFTSVGNPDVVQINSLQIAYQNLGKQTNI